MPLGAPIGSNKGLLTRDFVRMLIDEIDLPLWWTRESAAPPRPVSHGNGRSGGAGEHGGGNRQRCGSMARAFKLAVQAGRAAYLAGLGRVLEYTGEASSPLTGFLQD